ncbi:Metallo-dependent phosphatase-like protein [Truncatella angustata]|uniref:Double-strand break repair protein n=1 Tax=Truncatella angustata TaxID=152316 RepID=A0A9P8UQN0_9PEZI|nr:Metallo-dependent phosphatase-like protein [Truncatella angustata]KAH6656682.1 Metallo-dependent phosphatase-like protein [Truncatella angustata]
MSHFDEEDTIRILVATDNHVGYEERDSIRKDDSWQTFDEIMTLAKTQDVDMVLLAGDLFHENKPSRKSMFKVMRSLRKNCLGMKPCELQFLSDASEVFEGHFSHVNYEDPDINVSIPVFSIHGNHDDPSGEGAFCPLDILQVAGLVNYFGRVPEADNPQAKPILLQKGQTKLALYGLSNIRDERMYRNFRDHRVKWFRPGVQTGDWFNMLAVHQNHTAHTPTSYLPEGMLPEWLNLVVWGHEHECILDPQPNAQTGFKVIQPGSSVATSLINGEAVPKHVAVLSVSGRDFQIEKHRLKTVRPFVIQEIKLSDDDRFDGLDRKKDNRAELSRRLMKIVDDMIEEATKEWLEIQEDQEDAKERIPLPLIRLKVEYTPSEGGHYDIENPQRFSNRFAGRVANTNDVVYFWRKKKTIRSNNTTIDIPGLPADMDEETIRVDELVGQYLEHQSLKILPQAPFIDAVNQYVNKDDKRAMDEFVRDTLTGQVKHMLSLDNNDDDESEMAKYQAKLNSQFKSGQLKRRKTTVKPKPAGWDSDMDGHWEDQPDVVQFENEATENLLPIQRSQAAQKTQSAKAARGRPKKPRSLVVDDDEDMDDFVEEGEEEEGEEIEPATKSKARGRAATAKPAAPAKKAPAKATSKAPTKAPAKGRGRKAIFEEDSEEDDVIMDEEPPAPKRVTAATRSQPARSQPPRGAASQSQAKTKQTTINFSQKPKASQAAMEISDDEISDDDPFESMPAKTVTRKR